MEGTPENAPESRVIPVYPGDKEIPETPEMIKFEEVTDDFYIEDLSSQLPKTLLPGASFTFDVTYEPKKTDNHFSMLEIFSDDPDETEIGIALSGTGMLDLLKITPVSTYDIQISQGALFLPECREYTLKNNRSVPVEWSASTSRNWLDIDPSGGVLGIGEEALVNVCVGANANLLPEGSYTGFATFSNITHGIEQSREIRLEVLCSTTLPFVEDFEGGADLGEYWEISGTNTYRTRVESSYSPRGGNYHLIMDSSVDSSYSRNELTLTIDLLNYENVRLGFWMKGFSDEPDGPPPSPFYDGADFDGVAISEDGHEWYEVLPLLYLSFYYNEYVVDLDSAIATHGLSYNRTFKIRFNHYDDYRVDTDGFALDDIVISGDSKDDLAVYPESRCKISGVQGEPFDPECKSYALVNQEGASLDWSVTNLQDWLDVSPTSGTLESGEITNVECCINANAYDLPVGHYCDILRFSNISSGAILIRYIDLVIFPEGLPPDSLVVPLDYFTIQEAIDASSHGDQVIVLPGTYFENIDLKGKNICLRSLSPGDPGTVELTIIDGAGMGPVVTFQGTENGSCILSGFTITGDNTNSKGAVFGNDTLATIKNCRIVFNKESGIKLCHGIIRDNIISGNSAPEGAGLHSCNGIIMNNTISENEAVEYGGGLFLCNGSIRGNLILNNQAGIDGGGFFNCQARIRDNTIAGNNAQYLGGGLNNCNDLIRGNTITANYASMGGAMANCNGNIRNNIITENRATGDVGGGALLECNGIIQNNIIKNNTAYWEGGGIYRCNGTIRGNIICFNEAVIGGGISDFGGEVFNNTIYGNIAMIGGGVNKSDAVIANCILWQNQASLGDQLYFSVCPSYSCIENNTEGGKGNISDDPLFVDPKNEDFHLQDISPAIDAGNPDPLYNDQALPPGMGTERNDMGAYGGADNSGWMVNSMLADLTPYGDVWGAANQGVAPFGNPSRRGWLGFGFDPENKQFVIKAKADGPGFEDLIQVNPFGDVWVSLNEGYLLEEPTRWGWLGFRYDENQGWFPLAGDANGDQGEDLIQVTEYGDAWVARSWETSYGQPSRWGWLGYRFKREEPGINGALPLSGDVNGDGLEDLIQVTEYTDAWVALSAETMYAPPERWGWLGFKYAPYDGWYPLCGDVNADGMDDLVQITPTGDPWVSLSAETIFDDPTRWGWLNFHYDEDQGYLPLLGDVNSDGLEDLIQITPEGDAWVAPSLGDSFGTPEYWGSPGFLYSRENGYLPFFLDF